MWWSMASSGSTGTLLGWTTFRFCTVCIIASIGHFLDLISCGYRNGVMEEKIQIVS